MQSIKEKLEKSKWVAEIVAFYQKHSFFIYAASFVGLFVVAVFLFSYLNIIFISRKSISLADNSTISDSYIASKTGKTYYFPWCAAANRIKEVNRVWFESRADAEAAGYKPASNCHGLK